MCSSISSRLCESSSQQTYVGVHSLDLIPRRSSQNLDNFYQLVDARFTREQRLTQHQLGHDTPGRPNIYVGKAFTSAFWAIAFELKCPYPLTNVRSVVGSSKDQFGCTVVPRANVADVGLSCYQNLGRSKVTQLQDSGCWVEQQVLGLDVSVADSHRVDVCQ